ncbi:MAG: hypothetical protein ACLQJ7_05505 [Syntrophobacteraceae bacterium]
MPKRFAEYTLSDWQRLRPLTQKYKTLRYRLVNAVHMLRKARKGDPGALARSICGRKVLVTIAYSDLQLIEWQAQLIRTYLSQSFYLIADNSPDDRSAGAIARIAEQQGVAYIRLPANPWGCGSRSHGIAMNWLWRNVILPGEPEAFGFLDHDLFPTAPDDPFAMLSMQDYYGLIRTAGSRWFLWAGFCVFKFDSVRHKPLDFSQDWFVGLDTGGGNWEVLYRHVDRAKLREPAYSIFPFKPGLVINEGAMQWCGSWLHELGQSGRPELAAEKRLTLARLLEPHLATANSCLAACDRVQVLG